jgi:rhamnogalacturonyl hydrolase YesR
MHHNKALLELAYNQIRLYRQYLLDSTNLLQHIVLGIVSVQDHGHWSTGNGWFLSGMLRILRIVQLSPYAAQMYQEQKNIITWANELLNAIWKLQQPNGALLNYLDQPANQTFPESSGTALIAAATFRLASIVRYVDPSVQVNVPAAEKARRYIVSHVDSDGWLQGVVDPLDWFQVGSKSPEGQAFVLMMYSAYRDWLILTKGYY